MNLRNILLAGAAALFLGSCATPPPQLTADALLTAPYTSRSATPFDVSGFLAGLPAALETSFAGARFDDATGAMVVDDLVFALRDAPNMRIRVDRADIWGGDEAALSALFAGEITDVRAEIMERVALTGVRLEGLQWAGGSQSVAYSLDKFVVDGLSARSINLEPKPGAPEFATVLRTLAAVSNAYALNAAAYSGVALRMNDNTGSEVRVDVEQGFVRGYDGGRTEYERIDGINVITRSKAPGGVIREVAEVIRDTAGAKPRPEDKILQPGVRDRMRSVLDNPIAFIAENSSRLSNERRIEMIEARNADFAGALSWLAKWELPPVSETELLDFGSITTIGDQQFLNDVLVTSIDRSDIIAADFYWLVPSNLQLVQSGYVLNLLDAVDAYTDVTGIGRTPETLSQEVAQARRVITTMGLETLTYDNFAADWRWDGQTGLLDTGFAFDLRDIAAVSYGFGFDGPSLQRWDEIVRADTDGAEVLKEIAVNGAELSVTDYSLIERVLAWGAVETGETPENLRQLAVTMMRAAAAGARSETPVTANFVETIASFVEVGGRIDVAAAPQAPVTFEQLQAQAGASDGDAMFKLLGVQVTHTPE